MVTSKEKVAQKPLKKPVAPQRISFSTYRCKECGEEIKAVKGSVCVHCHARHAAKMEKV